ncbi:hypothetical protein [Kamptonema sp. UHCC 0994]|uniref:hypothetical protein n=1 Tax=Kamptonema sp. UHCC 0994 TaxID=3031329 RepID=UPI0023B9D59F|nr:hypothetical protein [Kamptonema sp. UHCC 0994]MDF0553663.1 hypothetical protein [Kamptonema sp. UHCC 0994]
MNKTEFGKAVTKNETEGRRRKKEEGRRKKEEGRRKKVEGRKEETSCKSLSTL